jgi:hypothetical protein
MILAFRAASLTRALSSSRHISSAHFAKAAKSFLTWASHSLTALLTALVSDGERCRPLPHGGACGNLRYLLAEATSFGVVC